MNFVTKVFNYTFKFPTHILFYLFVFFVVLFGLAMYFLNIYSSTEILGEISILLLLGILAGILQVVGYLIYILHENIDPNPVTWFMFAYGTAILTLLEWDMGATLPELILPATCSLFAIYVSLSCWINARKRDPHKWWPEDWWPNDKIQQTSFIADILITLGYVSIWAFVAFGSLTPEIKLIAVFWFLLMSNLSTFPAFYPIIIETYKHPDKENYLPWFIWSVAYVLLCMVTYISHEKLISLLMLYPVSNALLHVAVGFFASRQNGDSNIL